MLKLFMSYLIDRSQAVVIDKVTSDSFPLPQGIPQGLIKGPLVHISAHKGIQHIIYADDTQVYLTMKSSEQLDSVKGKKRKKKLEVLPMYVLELSPNKLMVSD